MGVIASSPSLLIYSHPSTEEDFREKKNLLPEANAGSFPRTTNFLCFVHTNYKFLKKEGKLSSNLHTKMEEKPVSGDIQLVISTHLDHAKKFVGDLLEVVAGDDTTARPLAQVTGTVFSQLSCSPIRT